MSIPRDLKLVPALPEIKHDSITHAAFSPRSTFLKRLMDMTGSVILLIVFAPLIVLIALLVRLSGP